MFKIDKELGTGIKSVIGDVDNVLVDLDPIISGIKQGKGVMGAMLVDKTPFRVKALFLLHISIIISHLWRSKFRRVYSSGLYIQELKELIRFQYGYKTVSNRFQSGVCYGLAAV